MPFLLDTDTCIHLINRGPRHVAVLRRIDGLHYGDVMISAISLAELRFGIAKSTRRPENQTLLEMFLARFEVADFDAAAADAYGRVRAELERRGTPIGPLDTLIAAHCLSRDDVLVTNNVREFRRVEGLRLENWISPS